MSVREATEGDITHVVAMGRAFRDKSKTPIPFDDEGAANFVRSLIESPSGVVLVTDGGMICGALAPAYFNAGWVMAVELAWWAVDRSGLHLLRAFEDWARANGANEVRMTTLAAIEGPERILARRGYATAEISYQKVI